MGRPVPAWARRCGLLAAAALLLAGCGKTVEFRPYDADAFQRRRVMVLEATALPPLPEPILKQVEDRVERALSESPYLASVMTRAELIEATAQDRIMGSNYATLSDVATVLGITDRELSQAVTRNQPVDLFATVQVMHLPCPGCEQDDRIALVAQLFDAQTASLRWRAHLSLPVGRDADAETLAKGAEALTDDLLVMLEHLLKPKWHRQRFEHLRPQPRQAEAQG